MTCSLDWRTLAACRGHDPDLWFPSRSETFKRDRAVAICRTCPVVDACGEYARQRGPLHGIWGGRPQNAAAADDRYHSPMANQGGLAPHGTLAAARRHARHGERYCGACLDAVNADHRRRKAERRQKAEATP